MAPRKKTPTPQPEAATALKAPRTVCPFTNKPLLVVETSAGWQVRGTKWHSTSFYPTKEIAEWEFSHNNGVPPAFKSPYPDVTVGEEKAPALPTSADAVADAEKLGNQLADETQKEFEGKPV